MLLRSTLLASAILSFGMTPAVLASTNDGLYVGTSAGTSFGDFTFRTKNLTTGGQLRKSADGSRFSNSIFAGYGKTLSNNIYLGAEIGTNLFRSKASLWRLSTVFVTAPLKEQMVVQDYFTADFLPGYKFNDKLTTYGRVGFSISNLKLQQSASPPNGVPVFNYDETKVGGRVGLGVDYSFAKHWGLGVDYTYSFYPNFKTYWSNYNVSYQFSPSISTVAAHLRYYFE